MVELAAEVSQLAFELVGFHDRTAGGHPFATRRRSTSLATRSLTRRIDMRMNGVDAQQQFRRGETGSPTAMSRCGLKFRSAWWLALRRLPGSCLARNALFRPHFMIDPCEFARKAGCSRPCST
jgi:hypothetical protein